jgi:hypothetical protein
MQGANIRTGHAEPHQRRLRARTGPPAPTASHPVSSGEATERLFHGIEGPVDVGIRVREGEVELRARKGEDSSPHALEREARRLAPVGRPERPVAGQGCAAIDEGRRAGLPRRGRRRTRARGAASSGRGTHRAGRCRPWRAAGGTGSPSLRVRPSSRGSLRAGDCGVCLDTSGPRPGRQRRAPLCPRRGQLLTESAGCRSGRSGTARIPGGGDGSARARRLLRRSVVNRIDRGVRVPGPEGAAARVSLLGCRLNGKGLLARIGAVESRSGAVNRRPQPIASPMEEPAWLMT